MFDPTTIKRGTLWRLRPSARWEQRAWRMPLATLGDREPHVLKHFTDERKAIELGYESLPFDNALFVPVYAPQDGTVVLAGETQSGFFASLEHPHGITTYVAHMSKTFLAPNHLGRTRRRQPVRAGDVIGYAAKSPIAIRFEVWKWTDRDGYVPTDPLATMASLMPAAVKEAA